MSVWWNHHLPSLTEVAHRNISGQQVKPETELFNPYEGVPNARQLTETVEEFLQRLPPATTKASSSLPWIFISNPYRKAPMFTQRADVLGECAPSENENREGFIERGQELLQDLRVFRNHIESQKQNASESAVNKAVTPHKNIIIKKMLEAAAEYHCTSGKVCSPDSMVILSNRLVDAFLQRKRSQRCVGGCCTLHSSQRAWHMC